MNVRKPRAIARSVAEAGPGARHNARLCVVGCEERVESHDA
jgi:hypothetical protein